MKVAKSKPMLRLYNSFSKQKEEFLRGFDPDLRQDDSFNRHPGEGRDPVSLYVCGITPYDYAHIGHGRCYVHFDTVHRTLKHIGYDVSYVRNVTDIDDKILKKAGSTDVIAATHVAQTFTAAFHEDMTALGCGMPDHQPTVSGHSQQIIDFIQGLLDNGSAYQAGHDIYFDATSFAGYGQLARRALDEQEAGARVAMSADKRHPHDFVLWKGNGDGQFWQAPWGYGRPGWHIECSTFVKEYLGDTIDIHGGGADLLFPHHENERAQSESLTGKPFVRYWLHNAHVTLNKEKMSKSTGNFFTLRDIFKQFDPMVLRFYFLQHHYRTPLDFTHEHVAAAEKAYRRLVKVMEKKEFVPASGIVVGGQEGDSGADVARGPDCEHPLYISLLNALCDDFNTPKLLGIIFGNLPEITSDPLLHSAVRDLLRTVLGLSCQPFTEVEQELSPEVQTLIEQRAAARAAKDWATADKIRDQLQAIGVEIVDRK
ncbi:MAG: cysteine--tRNA ligase [Candidatus Dependentiae bacterium]|jgi:cysteinyl-tRNA synthetase